MTTSNPLRIGGWLLAPLAWLLLTLFSITITLVLFGIALTSPHTHHLLGMQSAARVALWYFSLLSTLAMWLYTLWLTTAFFKRRAVVRKHYIIWLLINILLALKTFAFTPVIDALALRQLLYSLLAAALFAPYFRRAIRVKQTLTRL